LVPAYIAVVPSTLLGDNRWSSRQPAIAMTSALRHRQSDYFSLLSSTARLLGMAFLAWIIPALGANPLDKAEQLFNEAQAAKDRGDLAEAEKKYLELVRQSPQMRVAYHNLGIVYLSEHKYQDAVLVLQKAVTLAPNEPGGWFVEGLAYYELYEPEKAIPDFRTTLRLDPADRNAQLYLGKAQIQMRDYRGAAHTFEKLSTLTPTDSSVLYNLGVAHLKLMLEDFDRLAAAAPQSSLLSLLLAQDAESRGDEDAAIRFYKQALHGNSQAQGVHYALGSIYANSGKSDEAAQEFREELKLNANDSLALWKLGEVTLRTNPQAACDELERALTLDPDLPQARLAYGRALLRLDKPDKAIEQFQQVERLAPEEDSVHYHLANAYRKTGRSTDADAEMAKFQELAGKKSAATNAAARREIEMTREAREEPRPDFDPSRDPVHH
jgi:tetratricopeptide (TPR) repeat protein